MENTQQSKTEQHNTKPTRPKFNLFSLIKKYFWYIVIFFTVSITSGVLLADQEFRSAANWETYSSSDAGLTFKHPKSYKIVEDKGWRITVYMSETNTENNIKIIYSHKESQAFHDSVEAQFLANCQATKVNEIDAGGTRIKVYEDSTCGAQTVDNSVIVYAENGMNYDIGLFGTIDRQQLYKFLSTFTFENKASATDTPIQSVPITIPSLAPVTDTESKMCGGIAAIQCPDGFVCSLDGDYPDAGGTCVEETMPDRPMVSGAPEEMTMCTMDAKECSDGSFVGRTGPNCEFVCPD